MPKRYRIEATVVLYDGQREVDRKKSTQEFDNEKDARDEFDRKKNA
jgi:hypothetical protein